MTTAQLPAAAPAAAARELRCWVAPSRGAAAVQAALLDGIGSALRAGCPQAGVVVPRSIPKLSTMCAARRRTRAGKRHWRMALEGTDCDRRAAARRVLTQTFVEGVPLSQLQAAAEAAHDAWDQRRRPPPDPQPAAATPPP